MALAAAASILIEGVVPALPSLIKAAKIFAPQDIQNYLNMALGIIASGKRVPERLADLDAEIAGWVDKGKAPPAKYWEDIRARGEAAYATIKESAARRRAER